MQPVIKIVLFLFLYCPLITFSTLFIGTDALASDGQPLMLRAPLVRESKGAEYPSFADEVAITLKGALAQLGLEEVAVAIKVDSPAVASLPMAARQLIIDDEALQAFDEVVVVREATIFQQSIPFVPERLARSFFELDHDDVKASRPKWVRTTISLQADFYHIADDEYLGSLTVGAEHIDRKASCSRDGAMNKLERKLLLELKRIYDTAADVVAASNGEVVLAIGKRQNVQLKDCFKVIAPDRVLYEGDDVFLADGGAVAIGYVRYLADDSCRIQLIRQWGEHFPGSWGLLHPAPSFAIEVAVTPSLFVDYLNYTLRFHADPERTVDWGGGVGIIRIQDSQDHNDYGFGFSGFGQWRFHNGRRFAWSALSGLDLDIPFRQDDDGNWVSTALLSLHCELAGEILLSANTDLMVTFGYRHGFKTSQWQYSVEDENYSAFWQKSAPRVDNSGFMLSVGYRWLF